jgi:hypothetical protein
MKKKLKPVEFSAHERRVLELPLRGFITGKDAEALRKTIDAFPWMLTVAECKFDKAVALNFVMAEGQKIAAENIKRLAIKEYIERTRE